MASWFAGLLLFAGVPGLPAQDAVSPVRSSSRDSPEETATAAVADHGVSFPVELTTEVLGNLAGGTSHKVIWESLFNVGIALDLEKLAGWKGGSASLRVIYPQGSGLTDATVHDFNTLSNIDGYDSLRLYDVWLQQELWEGRFSIRLGQLLADAEFFNSAYGALFLNSSFGAIPLVSQNLNPPIFPTAAPGVRFLTQPNDSFYAETALFSGDAGDPATNNRHNTRLSFRSEDGALVFAEVGYTINPKAKDAGGASPEPPGLTGTYKLGGYYDSADFAASNGRGFRHGEYSVYFVTDQEFWRSKDAAARALALFARLGAAPDDRSIVAAYGDIGLNYKGFYPGRDSDILGVAFSYAQLSDQLVDETGAPIKNHHEAVVELTYQAPFGSHLSLQPDLQMILNPGATRSAGTAVIAGLRLDVGF